MENLISKLIIVSSLLFLGCSSKFEFSKADFEQSSFSEIPTFTESDLTTAFNLFKKSCHKNEYLKRSCNLSKKYTNPRDFFEQNFTPFFIKSKKSLATGYFEPLIYGSRVKSEKYRYPIYEKPTDLVAVSLTDIYPNLKKYRLRGRVLNSKLVPYYDREYIDKNGVDSKVICYSDDKIDLFFLHIQGSGRVRLDSGETIFIGYSEQNGHKYYAIGRALKDKLKKISLESIKEYLYTHPDEVDDILNMNKSYIFFKEKTKSATGTLGIPLIPEYSIAVDREFIPLGFPTFVDTKVQNEDFSKLTLALDTGGAIKGQSRIDIFFGYGREAKAKAGEMKSKVKLWLLIPNELTK